MSIRSKRGALAALINAACRGGERRVITIVAATNPKGVKQQLAKEGRHATHSEEQSGKTKVVRDQYTRPDGTVLDLVSAK